MSDVVDTHYYPIAEAVGYVVLGGVLLVGSTGLLLLGIASLWFVLGLILAVSSVASGIVSLVTRKRYPMTMGSAQLTFYRKGQQVCVPVGEVRKVWYNTSGIDKRVSIALADGNVVDIPALYGLDALRKKLQKRYALPNK